jgi:predicted DCC family thiol-disulfide oxidoreductase YuxK
MTVEQKSEIQHPVILFDGVCNLCNAAVRFIIKEDKQNLFRFSSLQSTFGQSVLKKQYSAPQLFNSFILLEKDRVYTRSTAALMVAKQLSGGWPLLYAFIIIPGFIRDAVYNVVANNRYKWFGKKDECWIPTPALQSKFIE